MTDDNNSTHKPLLGQTKGWVIGARDAYCPRTKPSVILQLSYDVTMDLNRHN